MTTTLHGKVHGKTIQLDQYLGIPEGQDVEVQIRVLPTEGKWGEGILLTAGALADDRDWDGIMEEVHQGRKIERRAHSENE